MMKWLVMAMLVLLVGCGSPGNRLTTPPPPVEPFVGIIQGKLLVWLEDGRTRPDSFQVVFATTDRAKFSWIRNGVAVPLLDTKRTADIPPWNDNGDSLVAEPGVAWTTQWQTADGLNSMLMWGYYGGLTEATFVGRLRLTKPLPDPNIVVIYRGIWDARSVRLAR